MFGCIGGVVGFFNLVVDLCVFGVDVWCVVVG